MLQTKIQQTQSCNLIRFKKPVVSTTKCPPNGSITKLSKRANFSSCTEQNWCMAARLTESSQVYKKIYMAELKQLFLNRSTRDHQKANNDKRSYLFFADAIGFNAGFSERNHNLVSGCKNLTSTGNCTHSL